MSGLLSEYRRDWVRFDAVAGLTTAAAVIPQAMAYAAIAGLPVEAGMYVALVPMLVYALLGTSRPLSVSSTSTIAILFPLALAAAIGLSAGESVQWEVLDRGELHLVRQQPPQPSAKGTRRKQPGKPAESSLPGA